MKGLKNSKFESLKAYFTDKLIDQYSLKVSNALYSKLQKEYWKNEWVQGFPLIIAINSFHNPHASMVPDAKIIEYLYKKRVRIKTDSKGNQKTRYSFLGDIEFNNRKKPSGFFELENAEYISAVIFNNERPIWKFNRMGYKNFDPIHMHRYGFRYNNDPKSLKPLKFDYKVTEENHIEDWNEGFSVFHNPNAKHPLDKKLFSDFRQVWLNKDNRYDGNIPDFFPFTSQTIMAV